MSGDPGTTIVLEGVDGSRWDLLAESSPVSLDRGLGGLHLPPVSHHWTQAPGVRGRRWRGSQMDAKSWSLRVLVGDRIPPYRTGQAWRTLDDQFWRALSTDALASLVVNGSRRIQFRLDEGNDDLEFDEDPAILGRAVYPVKVVSDDPLYRGTELSFPFTWQPRDQVNYYGGAAGLGPPFVIAQADLFQTAMVANPGDLPAWATFVLTGPCRIAGFGVGDQVTNLPFVLNDGDVVIVDTEDQTIVDSDGNNLWRNMGFAPVQFAPVPVGTLVPVRIGLEDAQYGASVTVKLTPAWLRAWGSAPDGTVNPPPGGGGTGGVSAGLGHSPLGHGPLGH